MTTERPLLGGLMSENGEPKEGSFPLQHEWIVWYNEKPPRGVSQDDFEKSIQLMGAFSTIEKFWQHFNNLKPEKLPAFSTLRLFKTGIKPCWEDPANYHGGKWVLNTDKEQTSNIWAKIVLAAVGNSLDCSDELCGIVLSLRPEKDTIQIWNRSADPAVYQKITGELHSTLGLGSSEELLYQIHAGSMDFNANVRNKNSPVTKRRQGGVDNLSNKKEGNGFQQPNSPSAFVRHNNHHNGRHQYRNSGHNKTNGTPPEGHRSNHANGAENGKNAGATNGVDKKKSQATNGGNREAGKAVPDEEEDDLFKDAVKGALNKSWGDMESDSEEGSDTDSIWGNKTDGKVDWGELAEEEDEGAESTEQAPANSARWSDEVELWEAENGAPHHSEADGFVCVSRKRRGDNSPDRRSVSQDGLHRKHNPYPSAIVPSSDSYHKRTSSSEVRDNNTYKQRGRRNKNNSIPRSRQSQGSNTTELVRADSLSPRGTKLLDNQHHKRSASSEQGEAGKAGRRLSLSQDMAANTRRKSGGNRTGSPAPNSNVTILRPPPGLKGKTWSPHGNNQTSWAQITQGGKSVSAGNIPKITATAAVPAEQSASILSSPASASRAPTTEPPTTTPTFLPLAQPTESAPETQPPPDALTLPPSSSTPLSPPVSPVSPPLPAVLLPPPESSSTNEVAPVANGSTQTEQPTQMYTDPTPTTATTTTTTTIAQVSTTSSAEAQACNRISNPATPQPKASPRRKEKRKRKRVALKKEKENPDLRTHWFLLLSLIVLTCSVFCGIIVVHFMEG